MRKMVWFALGLAGAAAFAAYLFSGILLFVIGGVLLAVSIVLFCAYRTDTGRKLAILLCGVAVGLIWFQGYDAVYLSAARQMDQQTAAVSVRCTDYSFDTGYGTAVDGQLTLENKSYKIRVYLDEDQLITPGSVLHGNFRFRYTSPGGSKEPTYHRGQGIFLVAYQLGEITLVSPATTPFRYFAAYLRYDLLNRIDQIFPADVSGFVRALLLGDTTKLDYKTETHLMLSGIRHVAAVSGLHVSILFALVYFISGKRRYFSALTGIPCLFLFAALAGFSPSVIRACVMQALMLAALALNKEYDPPSALGFAVVTMLLGNPQSITSVGFQLSVASVAGIFLFSKRIYSYLTDSNRPWQGKSKTVRAKIVQFVSGSISVSLSSQILTLPLVAVYFGAVSLVCVLTNLLCLWAVSFLFYGILLSCILSLLYLPLGAVFARLISWIARYILGVSSLMSKIPCSAVYTDSVYIVLWMVFIYALLLGFFMNGRKHPVIVVSSMILGLCVSLLCAWTEPLLDDYRMTVLDVGQGQCILLQSDGKTFMVDCGGDKDDSTADKAASMLNSQGIYRLDGIILTHSDRDHSGAVVNLLSRVPAKVIIVPEGQPEEWYSQLENAHGDMLVHATDNLDIQWNDTKIRIYTSNNMKTDNDSGLCLLFQHEKCDILITGDRSRTGELDLISNNHIPDVDVLVVGHHGAKDATGQMLLGTVEPETAVISVSGYNIHGHPAPEVLKRLATYGCVVYRTDLHGNIIIRG